MFPWWPKAILPGLCLALMLPRGACGRDSAPEAPVVPAMGLRLAAASLPAAAPASGTPGPASGTPGPASGTPGPVDPFLAAMLGALPLASGFYVTSTPQKGLVFTLADAMLIGTIAMIRSDKDLPAKDVSTYYYLLGAVNLLDAALSVMQAHTDAESRPWSASRLTLTLNPQGRGIMLAWRY